MASLATASTTSATGGSMVAERARSWGHATDISARSALVTILGDTIAPIGGTAWLADVIALAEPFGFSERLVRTSMFRLAAEGWVVNERVGRRSRYSLTDYGREESRAAERRIYRPEVRSWDGWWTLVFLPSAATDADGAPCGDDLIRHLHWRGFARMADGVLAHPNDAVTETRQLIERLAVEPSPAVAAARFDGAGEAPLSGSGFRAESGLAEAEAAYHRFLDRYQDLAPIDAGSPIPGLDPVDAFALRTMVVHDLRRARLRDPDLPAALLADGWVGHRSVELAAELYRAVDAEAWRWVEDVTGSIVVDEDLVAARFTSNPTPDRSDRPSEPTDADPPTTKARP